ncbi:MAG: Uma2 family endonuclease [Acidobacteria bacterium]|nr:MAG: Uma2 family endonuclease [Acidobacteriota bacterium]
MENHTCARRWIARAGRHVLGGSNRLETLDSKPEPDVAVMSHPDGELFGTDASEPLVVVEVSDSSLRYDLTEKAALYAASQIADYWVVDLEHRVLVVFRDPRNGVYETRETYQPGSRIGPCRGPISSSM